MGHTLTIRLSDELLTWLTETSRKTGFPLDDWFVSSWRLPERNVARSDFYATRERFTAAL